jgi:hypothetical protein
LPDIDSDSALTRPIDPYIREDDELVIGYENNDYDADWCYSSHFSMSTLMQTKLFTSLLNDGKAKNSGMVSTDEKSIQAALKTMFRGRMILNWCIMAAPRHQFLKNALDNFVELVELEYLGLSAIKMQKYDKYSKHIYCTTGPFLLTATCREAALKLIVKTSTNRSATLADMVSASGSGAVNNRGCESGMRCHYRLTSKDFGNEGGKFKVVAVNKDPKHYTRVKTTGKNNMFLLDYANETTVSGAVQEKLLTQIESQLVMGRSRPSIYFIGNGTKRSIDNMDTFNKYGFSLVKVIHLSDFVINLIPAGHPLE